MQTALDKLIESAMPRVDVVANSYRRKLYWMSLEDIRAEGYMVIAERSKHWDPRREAAFWTYVEHRVRGRYLDLARTRRKREIKIESLPDEQAMAILGGPVW